MLDVTMKIDTSAFHAALPAYLAMSKSTTEEVLIRRAFFIALGAMQGTPTTGKEKLIKEMGEEIIAQRLRGKPGPVKRIYALVQVARRRVGLPGAYGEDMKRAASNLTKRRVRSLGAFKAGWLMAINTLGQLFEQGRSYRAKLSARKRHGVDRVVQYYSDKASAYGECTIHSTQDQIGIRIGNNVYFESANGGVKYEQAVKALQKAIDTETKAMIDETERRLQKEYETGRRQAMQAVFNLEEAA